MRRSRSDIPANVEAHPLLPCPADRVGCASAASPQGARFPPPLRREDAVRLDSPLRRSRRERHQAERRMVFICVGGMLGIIALAWLLQVR